MGNHVILKKTVQTIIYLPHFLSWVIVTGLFISILGTDGIINQVISPLVEKPIRFFIDKSIFRSLLVVTDGWKSIGWGVLYI